MSNTKTFWLELGLWKGGTANESVSLNVCESYLGLPMCKTLAVTCGINFDDVSTNSVRDENCPGQFS